jgi:hypothetical protein
VSQIYKPAARSIYNITGMHRSLVVLLFVLLPIAAHAQTKATAADLGFVAGCWRLEGNGRVTDEHWLAPAGGTLLGVSRTVAGGKTVEYEFLQIRETPQGLAYIAKPSGQPEATFVLASRTADEVVFENPAHDFPQRIRYRRAGANALQARIEGTMNGKSRGVDFPYKRVSCTP